jgi:hypothetical protein
VKSRGVALSNDVFRFAEPPKYRRYLSVSRVFRLMCNLTTWADSLNDCLGHKINDPDITTLLDIKALFMTVFRFQAVLGIGIEPAVYA